MNHKQVNELYERVLSHICNEMDNDGTTKASDLDHMGKKMFGSKFLGIYSADTIPKMNNGTYIIVNTDDSNGPGEHWMGLVKNKSNVVVYDSFGRKTIKILPEIYQSGNGCIVESENDAEQKESEDNCGQRVLAAIYVYDKHGLQALKKI